LAELCTAGQLTHTSGFASGKLAEREEFGGSVHGDRMTSQMRLGFSRRASKTPEKAA
jgi:hypothetical protein